jgi:hypothetical protein
VWTGGRWCVCVDDALHGPGLFIKRLSGHPTLLSPSFSRITSPTHTKRARECRPALRNPPWASRMVSLWGNGVARRSSTKKVLAPTFFRAGVFCAAPLAQPRAAPALPSPSLSSLPSAGVSRRGPSALPPESLGAQTTREKFLRPSCGPALLGGRGRLRRARRADVDAVLGPGHEDEVGPPNTPTNAVLTPTPLPPLPPPPSQPTASPGRSGRWRS